MWGKQRMPPKKHLTGTSLCSSACRAFLVTYNLIRQRCRNKSEVVAAFEDAGCDMKTVLYRLAAIKTLQWMRDVMLSKGVLPASVTMLADFPDMLVVVSFVTHVM
jgi:hypothetical protein